MLKNVASQIVGCQMSYSDGTAFTGTVTVYVTVDNDTQTIGSVGSGVCSHKGNGLHNYVPSQAETNGNTIQFTFIGVGAVSQTLQFETLPTTGVVAPTVSGRTLDISAGGEAGIDWANIGSPATSVNFSGTTISTSQAVASVSGAVGSVTGNVGGNVTGSVGSVATNGITATSLATDAGTELATAVWSSLTSTNYGTGSLGNQVLIGSNTNRSVLVTGSNHAAADVHAFQTDAIDATALAASAVSEIQSGLATSANQTIIIDGIGYTLAQVQGAVSSPQTSTPVYATSFNGSTYTVTHTGVTSTGVRGTATRAKT